MGLFDGFTLGGGSNSSKQGDGERKFERLPEAEYDAVITNVEIDGEKQRVSFKLKFPGLVTKDGVSRYKSHSIKSQKAFDFLMGELEMIGVKPKSTNDADVIEAIESTTGLVVTVNVRNQKDSDQYQNFYFKKRVGRDRNVTAVKEAAKVNVDLDDDLPF